MARQGQGNRPGLVPRPGRRPGDRRGAHRHGEPSGRLPITFPESLAQTPRPELSGLGTPFGTPTTIQYNEGAEVGYRWFAKTGAKPLYAFSHGISYTTFAYGDLVVHGGDTITASFTATNTADREGGDVPQLYLTNAAGEARRRLLGFDRVELAPGRDLPRHHHRRPAAARPLRRPRGPLGHRRRRPPRGGRHLR